MNTAQRIVLCAFASVILWLSVCTPRVTTGKYNGQPFSYQEGHHYFWEQNWADSPTDYTRLAFELTGTALVCCALLFALKSQRAISAR